MFFAVFITRPILISGLWDALSPRFLLKVPGSLQSPADPWWGRKHQPLAAVQLCRATAQWAAHSLKICFTLCANTYAQWLLITCSSELTVLSLQANTALEWKLRFQFCSCHSSWSTSFGRLQHSWAQVGDAHVVHAQLAPNCTDG